MVAKQSPALSVKSLLHVKDQRSKIQRKHLTATLLHRQQIQLRRITSVYAGGIGQAIVLQRLFDTADGLILSEDSLARIAQRICTTWEQHQPTASYCSAFVKFIKFVLSHTNQPGEIYTLDYALRICHHRRSAFPTVHAPLVLLLALGYLERLSQRYHNTKGELGCAQRLFLMSYTIAAKYLHANLAFLSASFIERSDRILRPAQRMQSPISSLQSPISSTADCPEAEPVTPIAYSGSDQSTGVSDSLRTMTTSTDFLSRMIPNVTTRELYRMEMELLSFLDYDLAVYNVAEVEGWRDLYVAGDAKVKIKQEEIDCYDDDSFTIKSEQEDEGIGHYEPEDGGYAEDALARGNLLM